MPIPCPAPRAESSTPGVFTWLFWAVLVTTFVSVPTPVLATSLVPDGAWMYVDQPEMGDTLPQQPYVVLNDDGSLMVFWRQDRDGVPDDPLILWRYLAAGTGDSGGAGDDEPIVLHDPQAEINSVGGLDDVAGNGGGDFVVGWIDPVDGVQAQLFPGSGSGFAPDAIDVGFGEVSPGEVVVAVSDLQVGLGDDREVVVAFVQDVLIGPDQPPGTVFRVVARRYDADGDLLGPQILITAGTSVSDLDLAVAGDGSFVAGVETRGANDEPILVVERYDAAGDHLTPPFGDDPSAEATPRVAFSGGGAHAVAFRDVGGVDGDCIGVFARFADPDTELGRQSRVTPEGAGCPDEPRAAGLADGWVFAWHGAEAEGADGSHEGVYLRTFDGGGDAEGGALRVLPGYAGPVALAANGSRAAVAAVLAPRSGQDRRLIVQRLGVPGTVACGAESERIMCFHAGRYRVEADWDNPYEPFGTGLAFTRDVPVSDDSEAFWFFRESNLELMVKVIDGRVVNGHYWVFYGSLSTVEFWMAVTDLATGEQRVYYNPQFEQPSVGDAAAFDVGFPEDGAIEQLGPFATTELAAGNGAGVLAVPAAELGGARYVAGALEGCGAEADQLCLQDETFNVTVSWDNPRNGQQGIGHPVPLTSDTGAFWFFNPDKVELMIKILDGRAINGHWWVIYAGLSDVEYTIEVESDGDVLVTYGNEPFELRSRSDTTAIPEDALGGGN